MNLKLIEHKWALILQLLLTIAILVLGILSFLKDGVFTSIFYLLVGCDLLVISYNNNKVFSKSKYNWIYIVVGIIILLFSIYSFFNYYKVV